MWYSSFSFSLLFPFLILINPSFLLPFFFFQKRSHWLKVLTTSKETWDIQYGLSWLGNFIRRYLGTVAGGKKLGEGEMKLRKIREEKKLGLTQDQVDGVLRHVSRQVWNSLLFFHYLFLIFIIF